MFPRISFIALLVCVFIVGCGGDEETEDPSPNPRTTPIVDPGDVSPNPGTTPIVDPGDQPVHKVIDGILERGSRVKVTNTIVNGVDKRLRIRNPAGIESPIIGSAAEGATGTILDGPGLGDGWAWWEIAWDDNGKVAFNEGQKCCIGWSAETDFDQNVRYLTEIR